MPSRKKRSLSAYANSRKGSGCKTSLCRKCRDLLGKKIGVNMRELSQGRWKSRTQAIAVSYSEAGKLMPRCKKLKMFKRSMKMSKRSKKSKRSRK